MHFGFKKGSSVTFTPVISLSSRFKKSRAAATPLRGPSGSAQELRVPKATSVFTALERRASEIREITPSISGSSLDRSFAAEATLDTDPASGGETELMLVVLHANRHAPATRQIPLAARCRIQTTLPQRTHRLHLHSRRVVLSHGLGQGRVQPSRFSALLPFRCTC